MQLDSTYDCIPYIDAQGVKKVLYPQKILEINNISNLNDLANSYFLVSSLCETLNKQAKTFQKDLEELEAKLTLQFTHSEDLRKLNNNKKPTKDMIESCIKTNDDYKRARSELIEIQSKYNILNNLMKAIIMKKDLLQTLNSNARVERSLSSGGFVNTGIKNQFTQ